MRGLKESAIRMKICFIEMLQLQRFPRDLALTPIPLSLSTGRGGAIFLWPRAWKWSAIFKLRNSSWLACVPSDSSGQTQALSMKAWSVEHEISLRSLARDHRHGLRLLKSAISRTGRMCFAFLACITPAAAGTCGVLEAREWAAWGSLAQSFRGLVFQGLGFSGAWFFRGLVFQGLGFWVKAVV